MKKICLMVIMIAIGFSLWADETDILKYINALKVHEIVWMTRTTDDGQVVKAETTNDLPDLFFGRYTNTEAIKSWRQADFPGRRRLSAATDAIPGSPRAGGSFRAGRPLHSGFSLHGSGRFAAAHPAGLEGCLFIRLRDGAIWPYHS